MQSRDVSRCVSCIVGDLSLSFVINKLLFGDLFGDYYDEDNSLIIIFWFNLFLLKYYKLWELIKKEFWNKNYLKK